MAKVNPIGRDSTTDSMDALFNDVFNKIEGVDNSVVNIVRGMKTPTVPVYDSTNWPDYPARGQIVRDYNDPTVLWMYGEDDQWHKVGGEDSLTHFFVIQTPDESLDIPTSETMFDWSNYTAYTSDQHDSVTTWNLHQNVLPPIAVTPGNSFSGNFFGLDRGSPTYIQIRLPGFYIIHAMMYLNWFGIPDQPNKDWASLVTIRGGFAVSYSSFRVGEPAYHANPTMTGSGAGAYQGMSWTSNWNADAIAYSTVPNSGVSLPLSLQVGIAANYNVRGGHGLVGGYGFRSVRLSIWRISGYLNAIN